MLFGLVSLCCAHPRLAHQRGRRMSASSTSSGGPGCPHHRSANRGAATCRPAQSQLILGLHRLVGLQAREYIFSCAGAASARRPALRRHAAEGRPALRARVFSRCSGCRGHPLAGLPAPAVRAIGGAPPLGPLDYRGRRHRDCGFLIEAIADLQLTRFARDPVNGGRVLDSGLWAWSRHPNYFGDAPMWWGLFFL